MADLRERLCCDCDIDFDVVDLTEWADEVFKCPLCGVQWCIKVAASG